MEINAVRCRLSSYFGPNGKGDRPHDSCLSCHYYQYRTLSCGNRIWLFDASGENGRLQVLKELSNPAGNTRRVRTHLLLDALLIIAVIALPNMGVRQQLLLDSDINRADQSADAIPKQARHARAKAKDQGDFMFCVEPRIDFRRGI